ncbi:hypothetical protein SAMN05660236_5052 [Ohtaekwangia koreensis]|uniref:Uncharacterized protein n=1 Tax=Ohtaekwangia koreensis TaxID=688867 RepID=A0A1T5MCV5_9BACT|nr:hypothetical protein SAMN05660236_5052 [Ohtaekwangia koreensis]
MYLYMYSISITTIYVVIYMIKNKDVLIASQNSMLWQIELSGIY